MRTSFLLLFLLHVLCAQAAPDERPVLRAMSFSPVAGADNADKVDINRASASELSEGLKGIGAKKAQAIIEYRNEHGAFRSLRDLEQVKGIGPVLVKKNRHLITLSDR